MALEGSLDGVAIFFVTLQNLVLCHVRFSRA